MFIDASLAAKSGIQYNKPQKRGSPCLSPPRTRLRAAAMLCLFVAGAPVGAQTPDPTTVPWAYSAYFGTGWYHLSESRDVFVVQASPRLALNQPSFEDGDRHTGLWFEFPLSVGFENFGVDDPTGVLDLDNVAIVSLTPAVAATIPVNEIWTLRPFAAAGWGTVIGGSESAWAYWGGIKSRLLFDEGQASISIVNLAGYVGNSPRDAPSDFFVPVMAGVELDLPVPDWKIGDDTGFLSWHLSYTRFVEDFDVFLADGTRRTIPDQWEIGMSFGKVGKPLEFWWLSFERFGVAYRRSSDGDLEGIGLVFRSLFDR